MSNSLIGTSSILAYTVLYDRVKEKFHEGEDCCKIAGGVRGWTTDLSIDFIWPKYYNILIIVPVVITGLIVG